MRILHVLAFPIFAWLLIPCVFADAVNKETAALAHMIGKKNLPLLTKGLKEAETFRLSLFAKDEKGKTQAERLARAIVEFQKQANQALQSRPQRPDLSRFYLEKEDLILHMKGNPSANNATRAFQSFRGKWHGQWDAMQVDHDWKPVQTFSPPIMISQSPPLHAAAVQYAWIGDGFGWNVLAYPNRNSDPVILGSVYHIKNGDPNQITQHRPHVGIRCSNTQLLWLTKGEIFLEEILPSQKDRYAITGFFYKYKNAQLTNRGEGFQAVYTRNPNQRPAWIQFPLQIKMP